MMKLMRIVFIFTAMLLMGMPATALHIKGGWMSYIYLGKDAQGNNRYEFTIKVYRDCGPQSPQQNDAVINVSIFRNSDNQPLPNFAAPLQRNYTLRKSSFNPCISPVPDVCYVILEYKGIATLPPSPQGYTASFQRCCRINGIVNVQQPSNSMGNTYTIDIPGDAQNANHVENSSPIFAENDTAIVCFNSNFTLDYSAVDPDGDSLSYDFAPAYMGGNATSSTPAPANATAPPYASLPYIGSYSAQNPFGTTINLNKQTGLITGRSPSATGEYVIAVVVSEFRQGRFIASTRKELHVSVANCSTPDASLPPEIVNCDSLTVFFENQSISSTINSYYWEFGAPGIPGNISDITRPTFTYPDTGTYVAKLVVNRGQTCSDSVTTLVKVYPGFAPGFTADGACFSNPFTFNDTTFARYGRVTGWRWDFGNAAATNDTSRSRTPAYTYPSPGTYQVTLTATSDKGCMKTTIQPLEVFDRPALNMPFRDTLICSIDSLRLRAIGSGNFSWTPATGRIINANTPNPVVFPLTTTTYRVTLNDRGCVTSDSITVNVLDFIEVDAGPDTTICRGDAITLQPITRGLSFQWSPAATLSNAGIRNPVARPTDSLTRYVVIANLGKCQAMDSMLVKTAPYPFALAGSDTAICFGGTAQLSGFGNGIRVQWTPATGLSNPLQSATAARPNATTTYRFLVFGDNPGCPKPGVDSIEVKVVPQIFVNAGRDTALVFGQPIRLNATASLPLVQWTPATGLNNTATLQPVLTLRQGDFPPGTDTVRYTLRATSPEGCTEQDDLVIRIFSTGPSIFVPNAFTPNKDGLNDRIRPILAGVERLDFFRIFNRFGQLIFEARETELAAWDGTFKGQPQGSGNYVYMVQAVDYTGAVLRQNGSFVLIR